MKKFLFLSLMFSILTFGCYAANDYLVFFNQKSHIYHNVGCEWAKKCTQNCIFIKKSQALTRGGRACKVCGG